jgi:hypothetical protein
MERRITIETNAVCTVYSGGDPPLEVVVGKGVEVELGSSESTETTLPMMVEANAQTSRRLLTTEGNELSSPNTHVWFVWPKLRSLSVNQRSEVVQMHSSAYQSTHWGKADRKVSVQAQPRTSMKAPGLKII